MASTTRFTVEKRLASGFPSATKTAGRLYFISDQGGLFLGTGSTASDYIQIGVGIGASNDSASAKTYYGLKAFMAGNYVSLSGGVMQLDGASAFYIENESADTLFLVDGADDSITIGYVSSLVDLSNANEVRLPSGTKILKSGAYQNAATENYVDSAIAALGTAISFVGESTTDPLTSGATVSGHTTWKKGEVVTYGVKEYILVGTSNIAANWRSFGDEGSYALKTVSITGTGYLTGGGNLTTNRTLDINQATKNKIDGAVQAIDIGADGTWLKPTKSGTTVTFDPLMDWTGSGRLACFALIGDNSDTLGIQYNSDWFNGTPSNTNKILTKSGADSLYAAKSSAITSITFAGTALTVSSNAASITQAAARTALGLGSAAYVATTAFATAAQGTKADSAVQSVASGNTTALTVSTSNHAVTVTPVTGAVADNNGKLTTAAQVKTYVDAAVAGVAVYWESF